MIPASTVHRVSDNTADAVNKRIDQQTRSNVARLAGGTLRDLNRRLNELDAEWDVERVVEANASVALLTSLALGATVDRRWFGVSAAVAGFLLLHAVQGWCPPIPLLRRAGFRTSFEIDEERYALKVLRGDFENLNRPTAGEHEIRALERFENEGGKAYDEPPVSQRESVDRLMAAVRN